METSKKLNGQQSPDLTLFAADILANPSAPLANDAEPMTLDTCGLGLELPLANYDLNTQSWKTSEDISLWGDYKSLESLPKSGMTRSGVLFRQPDWVRPIDETELLLWPTPLTNDNKAGKSKANPNLTDSVLMRPNINEAPPTTKEWQQQRSWPTPRAAQAEVRNHTIYARPFGKPQNLENRIAQREPTAIGGKLNPTWVEWLMGFPLGWTDLED
jgi:hypothetical protein